MTKMAGEGTMNQTSRNERWVGAPAVSEQLLTDVIICEPPPDWRDAPPVVVRNIASMPAPIMASDLQVGAEYSAPRLAGDLHARVGSGHASLKLHKTPS